MIGKRVEIEAALETAAGVYDAFRRAAKPGASELDLDLAVRRAAGAHPVGYDLLSGPRTAGVEGAATERILQAGDVLLLDLCLKHGAHWCDVCRTYFLGEPDPAQKDAYASVLGCFELVAGLLKAGVCAGTLYKQAEDYFSAREMAGWMRHHTGHGIGLTPFEAPVEVSDSKDILRAGDVVTVEIGVYLRDEFGIRVEDDFFVSEDGAVNLWAYPKTAKDAVISLVQE